MDHSQLLFSVSEAAEQLGISRSMAYNLVRLGHLPHVFLGPSRVLRVPRAGLERWIEEQTCGGPGALTRSSQGPQRQVS
jgi:excisionase family DNA binding protein